MKVLVACEESQAVTKELRRLGHEAYSCDILPCSGGHPEWHLQLDAIELLKMKWDMIIAFPPCTYLSNAGARHLYKGGQLNEERYKKGLEAKEFFMQFVNADCDRIVIENPGGIMSTLYRKPDFTYNPYDFEGETECKKTCIWTIGDIKPLTPTQNLPKELRTQGIWKANFDGKQYAWNDPEVAKLRSRTPAGVAKAMAEQWG